jgi:hypothetical protein
MPNRGKAVAARKKEWWKRDEHARADGTRLVMNETWNENGKGAYWLQKGRKTFGPERSEQGGSFAMGRNVFGKDRSERREEARMDQPVSSLLMRGRR